MQPEVEHEINMVWRAYLGTCQQPGVFAEYLKREDAGKTSQVCAKYPFSLPKAVNLP